MNRIPVRSSNLRSIGYDTKSGTLEIEFHNRVVYHYFKVPERLAVELLHAKSPGRFFRSQIEPYAKFEIIRHN